MEKNKVIKKILYYVDVECVSPICVSNGEEGVTDCDVLKDFDGKPFIAGSSLAGAMRNYQGWQKNQECLFGFSHKDDQEDGKGMTDFLKEESRGRMSSVYISDLTFIGNAVTTVRDGVKLSDRKVSETEGKYDLEVVDTGEKGRFVIEAVIRKDTEEERVRTQIGEMLAGLDHKEIRLGAKKSRGFGELQITAMRSTEYSKENILHYKDAYDETEYIKLPDCKESIFEGIRECRHYIRIQVPIMLRGGISIRRYSAKKGEPDYRHLTSGKDPEKPVISGMSCTGAIRHRVKEILYQLDVPKAELLLDAIFGYVDKERKMAHKSGIVVGESIIEGAKPLTMVRNAVSRFESAAKEHALYKEKSYFGGEAVLSIYVQKGIRVLDKTRNEYITGDITDMVIGILLVALKDMQNGYLPVGGQTAVGRGIFEANGNITIDGSPDDVEQYVLNSMGIKGVLA